LSSGDKYIPARAAIFQSSGQIVLLSMIWQLPLSGGYVEKQENGNGNGNEKLKWKLLHGSD